MLDFFDPEGNGPASKSSAQIWFEKSALSGDKSKLRKLMEKVDHSKIAYEPFKKNFYIESTEISKMTEEEVERYFQ